MLSVVNVVVGIGYIEQRKGEKMAVKRAVKGRRAGSRSGAQSGTQAEKTPVLEEEDGMIGNLFDNMKDDTVVVVHRFDPQAGQQVLMYKLMPDEATDIEDR